jgi:hypothetical protein
MGMNIHRKADMLKNSCKATRFNYDTHGCRFSVNPFYVKAGWPNWRAIRSRWQAFFILSAFNRNIINAELII